MPVWWEHVRDLMSFRAQAHASLPDLRGLESSRARVEGTQYLPDDRQRRDAGDRLYVLRREPHDKRDPSTIAVYAQGRRVGRISRARSVRLAPLLDQLGGAAVVTGLGAVDDSSRLWVELPSPEALQEFARAPRPDDR